MDRAEILGDLRYGMSYLIFICHIAQIAACGDTVGLAGSHGRVELFLIEVHQCQMGTFACKILGHGAAQALATAGDNDYFVVEMHSHVL